ncbi:NF-kappa-B inhibitor cactus-like isoform X1 [Bacillus rossius redtenbacheri]|uniref:NF-kappa-B inhibitor cactus-like isoform X1 n=1 Tax=Bacillus rossius redtenbacheri TaxID=93214 RepID=UPI002FDE4091
MPAAPDDREDDTPTSLADSASIQHQGRAKTYLHGVSAPQGEQLWQNASGLSKEPSSPSMKGMTDSGLCDSGRTDSGFLSGANLTSECLSSDDITSSHKFSDSSVLDRGDEDKKEDLNILMRLDSGVDVGLNDQFGGLSLKTDSSINDLNSSSKSRGQDPTPCNIVVSKPTVASTTRSSPATSHVSEQPSQQPWELYFQQDEDGDTQLHIAIIRGFIEVVESLVQMVPHPCFLDISNNYWQTPLHLAVLTHQPLVARRLLVAGAKVDGRDLQGNTPLHLACQSGDLECVRALTATVSVAEAAATNLRGVGGWRQQVPQPLDDRNNDGQMCVHLATLGGSVDVLRHLVWFGADINAREGKAGRTPLYLAIEYAIPRVVHFLINECPLNLEVTTYSGHTAYQLAACLDAGLARFLAAKGAASLSALGSEDSSDSEHSDDEMFGQRSPFQFYASHLVNGGAIDIGA